MLVQTSLAAASAVVDKDLLGESSFRQHNQERVLVAAGLAGSAAAGDTIVDILIGNLKVATIFNSATGFNTKDTMFRVGARVPAGQEVHVIVKDAATTNPINLALDFNP